MNKRFIEKLQQSDRVLRYLYQHEGASTDELCAAGGCTQRTLLRIVSDVREMCGADIRWDTKKQRYAMINRHEFSPPAEPLDEQAKDPQKAAGEERDVREVGRCGEHGVKDGDRRIDSLSRMHVVCLWLAGVLLEQLVIALERPVHDCLRLCASIALLKMGNNLHKVSHALCHGKVLSYPIAMLAKSQLAALPCVPNTDS